MPLLASTLFPALAYAQGPEQLDQIELDKGEWQAEYSGDFSRGEGQVHSIELMAGFRDRLAIGLELEGQAEGQSLSFESFGPKIQYRFTSPGAPIAVGSSSRRGLAAMRAWSKPKPV